MSAICFGEILWDLLPSGKKPGGAPMNVAVHLSQLGRPAGMISRVGDDDLGRALLDLLTGKGVDTTLVQRDPAHPTGTVEVQLDEDGHATYKIMQPVAWDFIQLTDDARRRVRESEVFVFGSLSARNEASRETLLALLEEAPYRVFDVNLRPPHYSRERLEALLPKADLVKMNDEELDIIAGWYGETGAERAKVDLIRSDFDLKGVIVTKGAKGAILLNEEGFFRQRGFPVTVQDTVGSGDSFLAAFLNRKLKGDTPEDCLRFACLTGALVATYEGGTPPISEREVLDFERRLL